MKLTTHLRGLLLSAFCFAFLTGSAQDMSAVPTSVRPVSTDYSIYILLTLAGVLLIAIAALGQVLVRLTIHAYKIKSNVAKSVILIMVMSIASLLSAQDPPAAAALNPIQHTVSASIPLDMILALCVILTEIFVIAMMLIRIWGLINTVDPQPKRESNFHFAFPHWFDRVNDSVAIENEKDILLDHDYDGIKELDNQLPPWWKYGFILTIFWAAGYLMYFHVLQAAPLSAGEYANEMEQAKVAKAAYMLTAKNNVDETTIVYDKSYLADGQKIFTDNCVACHGAKGEGGVGPNLTDDHWIHGGKINDVFKTVKYGWPANGMKSWQSDFSSMQIAQVVCYVKSLKGSNPPNPKAPQGDVYTDNDSTASANAIDSLKK